MRDEYRLTEDIRLKKFWRSIFAEGLGVAIIVFIGCGSMLIGNYDSHPHYGPMDEPEKSKLFASGKIIRVAFAFGFAVATATWCLFHISGAHFNPAITIGMLAAGRISLIRAVIYCTGQMLGAFIGASFLRLTIPDDYRGKLGSTFLGPDVDPGRGVMIELFATFVVVFTYFASTDKYRTDIGGSIPLTIGLSVLACHLIAFPLTTCSLNPARSFAPALVANFWENHWVYWVGPIVGALSAALLYKLVFTAEPINRDYTTTTECPLIITTGPDDAPRQDPFSSPANVPLLQGTGEEAASLTGRVLSSGDETGIQMVQIGTENDDDAGALPATPQVEITRPETPTPPSAQPLVLFDERESPEMAIAIDGRQSVGNNGNDEEPSSVNADVDFTMASTDQPASSGRPGTPALTVLTTGGTTAIASAAVHCCGTPKTPQRSTTPNGQQIVQIAVDVD